MPRLCLRQTLPPPSLSTADELRCDDNICTSNPMGLCPNTTTANPCTPPSSTVRPRCCFVGPRPTVPLQWESHTLQFDIPAKARLPSAEAKFCTYSSVFSLAGDPAESEGERNRNSGSPQGGTRGIRTLREGKQGSPGQPFRKTSQGWKVQRGGIGRDTASAETRPTRGQVARM